jgi:hypothetical protein
MSNDKKMQDERELFEVWAGSYGMNLVRHELDQNDYAKIETQSSWHAWREARAALSAQGEPVAITDEMAYSFHRGISDGSLSRQGVEDIKAGLRSAFANVYLPSAHAIAKQMRERCAAAVEKAITEYSCQYTVDDECNQLPLVDKLCPPGAKTITEGLREMELLIDSVAGEVAHLPLPALSTEPASQAVDGLVVDAQGIRFGNAWYSHEKITGYSAEQLNSGNCKITGREYMNWLNNALIPTKAESDKDAMLNECETALMFAQSPLQEPSRFASSSCAAPMTYEEARAQHLDIFLSDEFVIPREAEPDEREE